MLFFFIVGSILFMCNICSPNCHSYFLVFLQPCAWLLMTGAQVGQHGFQFPGVASGGGRQYPKRADADTFPGWVQNLRKIYPLVTEIFQISNISCRVGGGDGVYSKNDKGRRCLIFGFLALLNFKDRPSWASQGILVSNIFYWR